MVYALGIKEEKSARYGIITVLFICACVGLSVGCQTHSQKVYSSQLNEIEAAKSRGELSGAEYLQLKNQAQILKTELHLVWKLVIDMIGNVQFWGVFYLKPIMSLSAKY